MLRWQKNTRGKERKSSILQWRNYVLINVRSILSSKDIKISGEKKENFHSNRTEGWWNRLGLFSTLLFTLFQDWDQVDLSFTDPLLVMLFSTGEKSLGKTVLPSPPMEQRLWKYTFCVFVLVQFVLTGDPLINFVSFSKCEEKVKVGEERSFQQSACRALLQPSALQQEKTETCLWLSVPNCGFLQATFWLGKRTRELRAIVCACCEFDLYFRPLTLNFPLKPGTSTTSLPCIQPTSSSCSAISPFHLLVLSHPFLLLYQISV